jgi:acetate kinase
MLVLTVNSGSTSVKLAAYRTPDDLHVGPAPERLLAEHLDGQKLDARAQLRAFVAKLPAPVSVVAHRVVHGGTRFAAPTPLDEETIAAISALSELAPLHNPRALEWIRAARAACGTGVAQVAVFDTAFFAAMPRVAAEYALPPRLGAEIGVRRYGFHGLAHEAMWRAFCLARPELPAGGRLITLQLGGGCSISCLREGAALDTSMGFSPLEGLVMATRCGNVDAAVVPYLQRRLSLSGDEVIELMNRESGLLGVSGRDGSPSVLLEAGGAASELALAMYCYRARCYIGAYLAVLGGCDGIVFGGGVGEHVPQVRAQILAGMTWAGIELDAAHNQAATGNAARIDTGTHPVSVHVIPVDEELVMVHAARSLHGGSAAP